MSHDKSTLLAIVDVQGFQINADTQHILESLTGLQSMYDRVCAFRLSVPKNSLRHSVGYPELMPGCDGFDLAFDRRAGAYAYNHIKLSCMTGDFLDDLKEWGIDSVHLAGIGIDSSILVSAVDLLDVGIEPVVLAGHCASVNGERGFREGVKLLQRLIGVDRVDLAPRYRQSHIPVENGASSGIVLNDL